MLLGSSFSLKGGKEKVLMGIQSDQQANPSVAKIAHSIEEDDIGGVRGWEIWRFQVNYGVEYFFGMKKSRGVLFHFFN